MCILSQTGKLTAVLLVIAGIETNRGPAAAVKMGLLNARSMVNKGSLVQDIIVSQNLDVLAVTETWITRDDPDAVKLDAAPADYIISHLPRPTATLRSRGGGVCIIHRNTIAVKRHPLQQSLHYQSFECQLLSVKTSGGSAASAETWSLAIIYRPPSSSLTVFYDELSDLFTHVEADIDADRFIACGDFNCPSSVVSHDVNSDLLSLLDTHGLRQFVSTSTRCTATSRSSLLDVVIANRTTRRLQQLVVQPTHDVSDHDLVTWLFSVKCCPPRQFLTYHFRSLKHLDVLQFQNDVKQSELFLKPAATTDDFADQLDIVTTDILNRHCPLQTRRKIAPLRQVNRWLSDRAVEAKRVRRRLERKWKSKGNRNDYVAYRRACRVANKEITKARSDFYSTRIAEAADDPRRRWSVIRDVLHITETKTYRSADESQKLCNTFVVFFNDKIRKAKEAIKTRLLSHRTQPLQFDMAFTGSPLDDLQPPTEEEVRRLISTMYNAEQVVTYRLHTDFRYQVVRRRLCTLNSSTGETVFQ